MAKKLYVRNAANNAWVEIGTSVPNIENYLTQSSASLTYATIAYVDSEISNLDLTPYATKIYADAAAVSASAAAVTYLIDAAPESLNTLNELAAALNDDANFAGTVTTALAGKLDISSASTTYATKTELQELDLLPDQTGNDGKYLTTTGASAYWGDLNIPPSAVLQSASPVGAEAGQIWVDSSASASYLNTNDFLLKADVPYTPVYLMNVGASASRPSPASAGMFRYNTDSGYPEWYDESMSSWYKFHQQKAINVEYLIVAGGGAGGGHNGGGGGAGGLLSGSRFLEESVGYSVIVGAGGSGGVNTRGSNGVNSVFGIDTAIGGGGGGGNNGGQSAVSGGSGGGAAGTTSLTGASGISGQGNSGGNGHGPSSYGGGGGGGAGGNGENATSGGGGNGGIGLSSSITGTSVIYAAGGGGAAYVGTQGTGGSGIGGDAQYSSAGNNGSTNTGSGGGATNRDSNPGGSGGSGIIVIKIPNTNTATFSSGVTYSTITSVPGYNIYRITATSTTSEMVTFS